jgi:hypothetical protein
MSGEYPQHPRPPRRGHSRPEDERADRRQPGHQDLGRRLAERRQAWRLGPLGRYPVALAHQPASTSARASGAGKRMPGGAARRGRQPKALQARQALKASAVMQARLILGTPARRRASQFALDMG